MAFTSPVTVITGQTITAAWGNTYVRDNTRYLKGLDGPIAFNDGASFAGAVGVTGALNATGDVIAGDDVIAAGSGLFGAASISGTERRLNVISIADSLLRLHTTLVTNEHPTTVPEAGIEFSTDDPDFGTGVTYASLGAVSQNVFGTDFDLVIKNGPPGSPNVERLRLLSTGELNVLTSLLAGSSISGTRRGLNVSTPASSFLRLHTTLSGNTHSTTVPAAGIEFSTDDPDYGTAVVMGSIGVLHTDVFGTAPDLILKIGPSSGANVEVLRLKSNRQTQIARGLVAGTGAVGIIDTTGKIPALTATYLASLDGSALTNLNASNLASGTIPDDRFPTILPARNSANLTNLNASELTHGTVPAGRLPTTVVNAGEGVAQLTNDAGYFTPATPSVVHQGHNVTRLVNDAGYLTSLPATVVHAGEGVAQLANDAGYKTSVSPLDADNLAAGTIPDARMVYIQPWSKVRRTSDQIIPQNDPTAVIFTERYQGNASGIPMWSAATPTRLKAVQYGQWFVHGAVYLRYPEQMTTVSLRVNGTDIAMNTVYNDTTDRGVASTITAQFFVDDASFYVELIVHVLSAGVNLIYLSSLSPTLALSRIGA